MTCDKMQIIDLLEGPATRLIVPVYQRKYDWKETQCKQLYDDLEKVVSLEREDHFFGSVVVVSDPSGAMGRYLIVDGQQRITTVTLLLLAMYRLFKEGMLSSDGDFDTIWSKYLVGRSKYTQAETKIKLIEKDQAALDALMFASEDIWPIQSTLVDTYRYFYKRIQSSILSGSQLLETISKLTIVNISLVPQDNPQIVFESLNSKGLPLDEGDKIRNYILMGKSPELQNEYYKKYWVKIEEAVQPQLSGFFRDYLTVKQKNTPNIKAVYAAFKEFYEEDTNRDAEFLLQELCAYAKRYKVLISEDIDSDLGFCICRLNRLETTVTRPFFLEVLRLCDEGTLTAEQRDEIFKTVEHYVFRRTICDLPTSSLNKIFRLLHHDIIRMDKTENLYLEKFKYVLLSKRDGSRYPDDEEFKHWLSCRNIYQMNGKNKKYLLERLEDGGTKEIKAAWELLDKGTYTIEHIMPQHLTPSWMEVLGEDYQTIHQTWLHRLANLTLTGYNSTYSNHDFMEKRTAENGFEHSGLRINQWIGKQTQWTLAELEERDQLLQKQAVQLWPMVITTYYPPVKPQDTVSLDDDISLTGRNITRFRFRAMEQPVESWAEMYQQVLVVLYNIDSAILTNLALSNDENQLLAIHFATSAEAFKSYRKINETLFVWTGTDTQYKVNVLKKLFALYDIDENDLIFYLKEEDLSQSPAVTSAKRKAYWTYALPLIQEALRNESFVYVNPTTGNYIDGSIGSPIAHLCCVANFTDARVELYLGGGQKEENEAFFAYLYAHKDEIETSAQREYTWLKLEEYKASKITLAMSDIDLLNEDTWPEIAKFHADEVECLYSVMKPWLDDYQTIK